MVQNLKQQAVQKFQPTAHRFNSRRFLWDPETAPLYTYNGTSFVLVGPQGAGSGLTQMQSRTVRDIQMYNPVLLGSNN